MSKLTTDALALMGLTPEEFRAQVVARVADEILEKQIDWRETFQSQVIARVKEDVDAQLHAYLDTVSGTMVREMVEGMTFPNTNEYGERRGETRTLLEHTAQVAKTYLDEIVDDHGKSQRQGGNMYGGKKLTRGAFLVYAYLDHRLETAISEPLKGLTAHLEQSLMTAFQGVMKATMAKFNPKVKAPR